MLDILKSNPRAQRVVGDVSWSNTPFAKCCLQLDDRVEIVWQTRRAKDFAQKVAEAIP